MTLLSSLPTTAGHLIAHGKSEPGPPQTLDLENDAIVSSNQVLGGMPKLERASRAKALLCSLTHASAARRHRWWERAASPGPSGAPAPGVVAPLWSVTRAHEVAIKFYEAGLKGAKASLRGHP
jgi:hypothetical protein